MLSSSFHAFSNACSAGIATLGKGFGVAVEDEDAEGDDVDAGVWLYAARVAFISGETRSVTDRGDVSRAISEPAGGGAAAITITGGAECGGGEAKARTGPL